VLRYGGIESGGTKTVVAIGGPDGIEAAERFPTGDEPRAAIRRAAEFLHANGPVAALGFGSFGPCDPNPRSATYGHVTTTPKPGWASADVVGLLREFGVGVPVRFDTDVNAAALAEWRDGAGKGSQSLLYLTVGTGIGGGAVIEGRLLHGSVHPEMGHQRIADAPDDGICPYHGNCWEGVASGPAIAAREGTAAQELPSEHPAWEREAGLLATGLANLTLTLSPEVIVLGGGVGKQPHVHALLRPRLASAIAGYVPVPQVVPPGLGDQAGVRGALLLAAEAVA
jgi:fructokinase